MNICTSISKHRAVEVAMRLVGGAKTEIVVTMQVEEELVHPLPLSYHKLLEKKVREKIVVTRYGFGSQSTFQKLAPRYRSIRFLYAGRTERYQRMLIVDRKKGLFSFEGKIFYTQYPALAAFFVKYVEIVYNKEVL